jgi:alginate O-acetyltransferase complex protein AlgI
MLFNSVPFVLLLLVTFAAWSYARGRARVTILLVASYLFYGSWNPLYLPLLLFSTYLDYWAGRAIERTERQAIRNLVLALSLSGNLGLLVYFKYWSFFLASLGLGDADTTQTFHVYGHVPPGLSFYTFQSISYTIDVYRRQTRACRSLADFSLYVAFFPQLVAGPILRSQEFLPQLALDRTPRPQEVTQAVELFLLGLFKKVVIADNVGLIVDHVFQTPSRWSGTALGLSGLLFYVQLYCDFSGYSTMAQGLGRLFGFDLPRNFDYPLLATDPLAFRRSWHITMSTWFRDYVFHPLGGSRRGPWRVAFNVMVVWALFGLWHGAAWTFALWGLYHGVIQAANRERLRRGWLFPDDAVHKVAGWAFTMLLFVPGALAFRAQSTGESLEIAGRFFTLASGDAAPVLWWTLLLVLGALHLAAYRYYREHLLEALPYPARFAVLALVTSGILVGAAAQRPFIYFQF